MEGVEVGAHEVVAPRLGRAVGAVRRVGGGLAEGRIFRRERAVNLVGRDVEEAEPFLPAGGLAFFVVLPGGVEHLEGPDEIGHHELLGRLDGPVHVGLGGEVHHRVEVVLGIETGEQGGIADVPLDKDMPGIPGDRREILGVPGVGQFVEVDHPLDRDAEIGGRGAEQIVDKVGADETGATGDENAHGKEVEVDGDLAGESGTAPARRTQRAGILAREPGLLNGKETGAICSPGGGLRRSGRRARFHREPAFPGQFPTRRNGRGHAAFRPCPSGRRGRDRGAGC